MCAWNHRVGPAEGEGRRHSLPSWKTLSSIISHDLLPCGKELTQIVGVHRFRAPQDCERSTVRISRARDEDTRVQDRLSPATQTIHASLLSGQHSPALTVPPDRFSTSDDSQAGGGLWGYSTRVLGGVFKAVVPPSLPALLPPPSARIQRPSSRGAGAGPRMRLPGPRW